MFAIPWDAKKIGSISISYPGGFLGSIQNDMTPLNLKLWLARLPGECQGLPLALVTVARSLGDKDEEEWKKAAR